LEFWEPPQHLLLGTGNTGKPRAQGNQLLTNENAALIPEGGINFSLLQDAKTGSGAYQTPIQWVPGALTPGSKASWA